MNQSLSGKKKQKLIDIGIKDGCGQPVLMEMTKPTLPIHSFAKAQDNVGLPGTGVVVKTKPD